MTGPRRTRSLLRIVVLIHTVAVVLQPFLAGAYLDGSSGAMAGHEPLGLATAFVAIGQLVAAVLYWRPGRGGTGPMAFALVLLAADGFQVAMGYTRALAVHIPLGVAIVVLSVGFAIRVLRREPAAAPRPTGVAA